MNPRRRLWLAQLAAAAVAAPALPGAALAQAATSVPSAVQRGRTLVFPRDHGAHLEARTEWWYATGWLSESGNEQPSHGFQITFFRSRTGLAADNPSRFAARHLLFGHAALSSLRDGRHHHDEGITRWSGTAGAALGDAATADAALRLGRWRLRRDGAVWRANVPAREFALNLALTRTQPLLLQGDAGFSRKGPQEIQASHYYSETQLAAAADFSLAGRSTSARGRAWLDHEWSDEILHPEAVGWDWIGINLFDGSALTAFQLRRRDGGTLWAGGSFRPAGGVVRSFAPEELRWTPLRRWRSGATAAEYPVHWQVDSPAGRHQVRALLDGQELDSRRSTGTVYWEGLSELLNERGARVGLGYLEMTGYVAPLRLA